MNRLNNISWNIKLENNKTQIIINLIQNKIIIKIK